MDTIWQTLLFRLAEHAQWIVPILIATGVLGLGPIGRALARRVGGGEAERQELEELRRQVAELQERADYNERTLGALRGQIPPESGAPRTQPPSGRSATPV
jgi:uncharacterized protein YbjT (DUF2867 family)